MQAWLFSRKYESMQIVANIVGTRTVGGATEYTLDVEFSGQKWSVEKRYSEFSQFAKLLRVASPKNNIPMLPPKTWTSKGALEPKFVAQRKASLQIWLGNVLAGPPFSKIPEYMEPLFQKNRVSQLHQWLEDVLESPDFASFRCLRDFLELESIAVKAVIVGSHVDEKDLHTYYDIQVSFSNREWQVQKRYNEFEWLATNLNKCKDRVVTPMICHCKMLWGSWQEAMLHQWLERVLHIPHFSHESMKVLKGFLDQAPHPMPFDPPLIAPTGSGPHNHHPSIPPGIAVRGGAWTHSLKSSATATNATHIPVVPWGQAKTKKHERLVEKRDPAKFEHDVTQLREIASTWWEKHHSAQQHSKTAFQSGNESKGRKLAAESRKYFEEMNEANEKCVDYIIKPQKIMIAGRVDLHGLHLKEAEQVVIDFLDHHVDKKIFQKVEIITGAGHHSIRKEHPVIRPMVLELLEARGLKYHAEHGNGAFLIDIVGGTGTIEPQPPYHPHPRHNHANHL